MQALANCEKVLIEDSTNHKALFRKGQALMARRDYSGARSTLKKLYELDPSSRQVIVLLKKADVQFKKDRDEEKQRMARMMREMIQGEETRQTGS